MYLPKMYPVNLISKSNPEKHIHQNLAPRHTLSKRTSRNLTRTLSRETFPPNPYLKTDPLKTHLTKPDQNAIPKNISAKTLIQDTPSQNAPHKT